MAGLIDVHHHIVPREYARALSKLGVTQGLGVQLPKWDVQKSLEIMEAHGISTAIVSISAPGVYFSDSDRRSAIARDLARQTNEICAELIKDHPGRFGAFATLPLPDVDAALDELAYSHDELGLYTALGRKDNALPEGPDYLPATIAGLRNYDAFTDADLRAIEHENTRTLFPTLR